MGIKSNWTAKGSIATVVLPIGYRSSKGEIQYYTKLRKSKEELFTHI